MKKLLSFLMLTVLISFSYGQKQAYDKILNSQQWISDDNVIVTASFDKEKYTSIENIKFTLKITNGSQNEIIVGALNPFFQCNYSLYNIDSRRLTPYSKEGYRNPNPIAIGGSFVLQRIKNNQEYRVRFQKFQDYFKLPSGGNFMLNIEGKYYDSKLECYRIFKLTNILFSIEQRYNSVEQEVIDVTSLPKIKANVQHRPYINKIKNIIKDNFSKNNKAFVLPKKLRDQNISGKEKSKTLPNKLFKLISIICKLNDNENNQILKLLGTPSYTITIKEENLILNGWLFDNGSILYAEYDAIKLAPYEYCWDSIEIPKNIKKVYVK